MNRRYYFKVFKVIVLSHIKISNTGRSLDGVTMDFSREDAMPTSTRDLLQSQHL